MNPYDPRRRKYRHSRTYHRAGRVLDNFIGMIFNSWGYPYKGKITWGSKKYGKKSIYRNELLKRNFDIILAKKRKATQAVAAKQAEISAMASPLRDYNNNQTCKSPVHPHSKAASTQDSPYSKSTSTETHPPASSYGSPKPKVASNDSAPTTKLGLLQLQLELLKTQMAALAPDPDPKVSPNQTTDQNDDTLDSSTVDDDSIDDSDISDLPSPTFDGDLNDFILKLPPPPSPPSDLPSPPSAGMDLQFETNDLPLPPSPLLFSQSTQQHLDVSKESTSNTSYDHLTVSLESLEYGFSPTQTVHSNPDRAEEQFVVPPTPPNLGPMSFNDSSKVQSHSAVVPNTASIPPSPPTLPFDLFDNGNNGLSQEAVRVPDIAKSATVAPSAPPLPNFISAPAPPMLMSPSIMKLKATALKPVKVNIKHCPKTPTPQKKTVNLLDEITSCKGTPSKSVGMKMKIKKTQGPSSLETWDQTREPTTGDIMAQIVAKKLKSTKDINRSPGGTPLNKMFKPRPQIISKTDQIVQALKSHFMAENDEHDTENDNLVKTPLRNGTVANDENNENFSSTFSDWDSPSNSPAHYSN